MKKLFVIMLFAFAASTAKAAVITVPFSLGTNIFTLSADQGFDTLANEADWFVFDISQLSMADFDLNRQQAEPDMIASLFFGDVTGYDFGSTVINDMFNTDIGPLTFIEVQDDTEDDAFGGLYGDPRFNLELEAGRYSLLVWGYFGGGTGLDVEFVASGDFLTSANPSTSVPAPSSLAVLALGLCGLVAGRRIKK